MIDPRVKEKVASTIKARLIKIRPSNALELPENAGRLKTAVMK